MDRNEWRVLVQMEMIEINAVTLLGSCVICIDFFLLERLTDRCVCGWPLHDAVVCGRPLHDTVGRN